MTLTDQLARMEFNIDKLKFLKAGWDGHNAPTVNAKTRRLAKELVESGFFKEEWTVGPFEDGSIVFTKKRGYKKIMLAAL